MYGICIHESIGRTTARPIGDTTLFVRLYFMTLVIPKNTEPQAARLMTSNELGFARDFIKGYSLPSCYERNYSVSRKMDNKRDKTKAASRILQRKSVKEFIEKARDAATVQTGVDASWVLKESERLYNKCIADDDNATARSTLELIGKNVLVEAFSNKTRIQHDMGALPMAVSFNISFDAPITDQTQTAHIEGSIAQAPQVSQTQTQTDQTQTQTLEFDVNPPTQVDEDSELRTLVAANRMKPEPDSDSDFEDMF